MTLKKPSRPQLAVLSEDNPKVRDEDAGSVSVLLNYLIVLLNIKANDDDAIHLNMQMLVVGELIKTKFGELTIPEIKEAFRMYVAREFPDIKPFRLLDAMSVGEVLDAFRKFKTESLHIYNQQKAAGLLEEKTEITESEKKSIREEWKADFMERFNSNGRTDDAWLMYDELIADGLKVSDERKKELYRYELEKYKLSLKTENHAEFKRFISVPQNENQFIINRCKSIIVLEYLEKLKEIEKMESEE